MSKSTSKQGHHLKIRCGTSAFRSKFNNSEFMIDEKSKRNNNERM